MEGHRASVEGADATPIGIVTGGDGPSLLLVHGGMASGAHWRPLWERLTRRYRVTAMDRRGRGTSGDGLEYSLAREFDDVIAVADRLAVEQDAPVDVFGHSFGAVCALGAAARGGPIRRLALYEPPGPEAVPAEWLGRMKRLVADGRSGLAMASFLTEIVGLPADVVMALRAMPTAEDAIRILEATMIREADALSAVNLSDLGGHVSQPVLLLLGDASPPWAAAITSSLARVLPSSRVVVLAGHGHEAIETAPDKIEAELNTFFTPSTLL